MPEKPRLLDQVRARIRTKNYSIRTEKAYVDWIRRLMAGTVAFRSEYLLGYSAALAYALRVGLLGAERRLCSPPCS